MSMSSTDRTGEMWMSEDYLLKCKAWAVAAWAATALLLLAAWAMLAFVPDAGDDHNESWHAAALLALSSAVMSAVAATLHVRSFFVRMCGLLRVVTPAANRPEVQERGVHPIR